MGQKQAAGKQARLQMIADGMAREANERQLAVVNEARERLGREMLAIPETTETENFSHSTSDSASNSNTQNRSWVDTDAMMAAAERSGFNPVTWLNAGGMQAYTQSSSDTNAWSHIENSNYDWSKVTKTGHNAADAFKLMVPEYALQQASQVPTQYSGMQALGGAISAGANAFGTQYRADQSADLQAQRLAAMALGNINKGMGLSNGNGLMTALMQPGNGSAGGTSVTGGLSGGSSSKDKGKGDAYWPEMDQPASPLWEVKKPENTNPFPPSWNWVIPPGYANAEAWEDSMGEGVSIPYGILKLGHTVGYNLLPALAPEVPKAVRPPNDAGWFRNTPGMRLLLGDPNVYSAPWMRSGSSAP